jgi:hypothetical protein
MKNSIQVILILFLIFPFFISCVFEPSGVFERKVKEDVIPPNISVVDLNLEEDLIYLYTNKDINFNFSSDNQAIVSVTFLIDNKEVSTTDANSGSFTLYISTLSEGEHTLTIEVFTKSGTGSIAENVGAEGFMFSKSWTIIVDFSHNNSLVKSIENGLLKLSWAKYKNSDFEEYIIYRFLDYNIEEYARTSDEYFIDNHYIGEGGHYSISVKTKNQDILYWCSLNLEKEYPNLNFSADENNVYTVTWSQILYYNAIGQFELFESIGYANYDYRSVKITDDFNDNQHTITDAKFGNHYDFILAFQPKSAPSGWPLKICNIYLSEKIGFRFNNQYQSVSDIKQVGSNEFVYYYENYLIKYSTSNLSEIQRITYTTTGCYGTAFFQINASASGKFLSCVNPCSSQYFHINTSNLSTNNQHDIRPYTGNMFVPKIHVSDVGTGIVKNIFGGFHIYNFSTRTSDAFYDNASVEGLGISTNGEFILLEDDSIRLVHLQDNTFTKIWRASRFSSNGIKYMAFHGANPNKLVFWDGATLAIKNCIDFSNDYQFNLTDDAILSIDYYSNRLLTFSTGKLIVRSLSNGNLLYEVPIDFNAANWSNYCYLVGDAIVSVDGIIYFLK